MLVVAIMIGIFAMSAIGTAAKTGTQYDLDDPEQRLAYEMSLVTGRPAVERAKYILRHNAELTLGAGKADGSVTVKGDSKIVTDLHIFMYIQRYESGKWKTVYSDNEMFKGQFYVTMKKTCTDSSAIIKGYDYRISYTIYAYKGMTYQQSTGTSPVVR